MSHYCPFSFISVGQNVFVVGPLHVAEALRYGVGARHAQPRTIGCHQRPDPAQLLDFAPCVTETTPARPSSLSEATMC